MGDWGIIIYLLVLIFDFVNLQHDSNQINIMLAALIGLMIGLQFKDEW